MISKVPVPLPECSGKIMSVFFMLKKHPDISRSCLCKKLFFFVQKYIDSQVTREYIMHSD